MVPLVADPKESPNACPQRAGVVLSETQMTGMFSGLSPWFFTKDEQFSYLQDDSSKVAAYWLCQTHELEEEDGGKLSSRKLWYYFTIWVLKNMY